MSESGADARAEVLRRIRGAVAHAPDVGEPPRTYRTAGDLPHEAMLDMFLERLEDYGVTTRRCAEGDVRGVIAAALAARGARRIVVPRDLDPTWRAGVETEWLLDEELGHDALDRVDGVLTTCAVAIAETGTIVLDGGPGQGRRAITLLPDYHLCVIPAEHVVQTVPEGVRRLGDAVRAGRPLTMISGPSATSDIELRRVEGVHGPRTLEVVLVGG